MDAQQAYMLFYQRQSKPSSSSRLPERADARDMTPQLALPARVASNDHGDSDDSDEDLRTEAKLWCVHGGHGGDVVTLPAIVVMMTWSFW